MKLGIFAKTFSRPTVEEVFAAVAGHRVRSVQFNFASAGLPTLPDRVEPALLEQIEHACRRHRVTIAALSGTFNMIHPDPAHRRAGLQRLEILAGTCAPLGVPLITLCTGTRDPDDMWRRHPGNDADDAWKDLLVSLTKALTLAAKHDLILGVEPELGNVINSAPKARRLLNELRSPRLRIILDAANLIPRRELPRMGEIMDEAFDLLGPDLALAHAKELRADGRTGGRLGRGVLDWPRYFALLRQVRWKGPVIVHGVEEHDVTASLSFLREIANTKPT